LGAGREPWVISQIWVSAVDWSKGGGMSPQSSLHRHLPRLRTQGVELADSTRYLEAAAVPDCKGSLSVSHTLWSHICGLFYFRWLSGQV
jgi:hypothetical protein